MRTKEKLAYMALGGILVVIGQLLPILPNLIASKAAAQSKAPSTEFDTVTVRSLRVVDEAGIVRTQLEAIKAPFIGTVSSDHVIQVFDRHGNRVFSVLTIPDGGQVNVHGNEGKIRAAMAAGMGTVFMGVVGDDGTDRVNIGVDSKGGFIYVYASDAKKRAFVGVEDEHGAINTWDKDGKRIGHLP